MTGELVVEDVDLMSAIHDHPHEAADALLAVQNDPATWPTAAGPMTVDSLATAAAIVGDDLEEFWVGRLKKHGLLSAFTAAMLARGVPLDVVPVGDFLDHVDPALFRTFSSQAQSFRCLVLVNGQVAGSGCLIGPSLVLTAWHVIAVQPPNEPQEPPPTVQIRLADGSRQDAVIPPWFASLCGDDEYQQVAPRHDDEVAGRHDVVLLMMRGPAAAHLGHVRIPSVVAPPVSRSALVLVHFPAGGDQGFGQGRVSKIRNVTARWGHDITTREGSSGGTCFDRNLELVGLHQGRRDRGGRFVPLSRFIDDLRPLVTGDIAPPRLWSLDGTAAGSLVIGRPLLLEALAAAGDDSGPLRGVRIKRRDVAAGGTAGLAFSHDILRHLLERRGADHVLIRLTFDELVTDAVTAIRERVVQAGLPLPEPPATPGVARGAAAPEGAGRDRATVLAAAVDAAAAAAGRTVWFFLDNPSVTVTDDLRLTLDGFVAAALVQPRLRLVIAGLETVPLAGQEFQSPGEAAGAGSPGLVVEYIGGFTRADVLDLLTLAGNDLTGRPPDRPVIDAIADRVLFGLPAFNGVYPDAHLETVSAALRTDLAVWARRGSP